jgi:CheY-like chemotaxis protein
MGKTFILGNSGSMIELGGTFREIPNLIKEVEIHNWVIELFDVNEINKIVIEIGESPLLSLKIGYHIRLSIESIREKVLVPIFYVSNLSLNSIIIQSEIYSQILATKGVFFSEFNLESNKIEIEHLNALNEREYLLNFLKVIQIQPDETVGRHSLANIWGAYAMDKAANSKALSNESEFKKSLYFKYLSAFNNIYKLKASRLKVIRNINLGDINKIEASGKSVLLIDDEASKGWETVLRKVFKTSLAEDFVVVSEKVRDFEAFSEENRRIIEEQEFDLYLVDLRLNGLDEDENIKTEDFSGMKILKKIKSLNKGNQVIVFTASNKVWNLKALLDAGADDYYMKESPEYNFSNETSKQNYKDFKYNVGRCFEKSYLREIYSEWKKTKNKKTNINNDFISESDTALDISWEQIKMNNLDFGFLTLFQSVESIANNLYLIRVYKDTLNGEVTIGEKIKEKSTWSMTYQRDIINGSYFTLNESTQESSMQPTALYKVSCLFKIKYQKDEAFLKEIGKLNKLRNDIAHRVTKSSATKEDLMKILKIIGEIRNSD